jgi:DNA-binding transcriptional MerR regulator
MDNELISKKELLELTGVSYGQLYRWKRKKLIPEEWFIRKSTYTGQETFFPREKIMERLDKIMGMKEDLSLDNIAEMFSPQLANLLLKKDDIIEKNIVTKVAAEIFEKYYGNIAVYSFEKILYLYVLDRLLQSWFANQDESGVILKTLEENYPKFKDKQCDIVFFRKLGVPVCLLVSSVSELHIESDIKMVERISLSKCIEELKLKLL